MAHLGAFTRTSERAPFDYASIDPACTDWSLFGGWKSSKKAADPVVPRIETHPFDPYTQARPDLYQFDRDRKEAIVYYSQTRSDGKPIGTVETTTGGKPRDTIMVVFWRKNGGADLEFDMIGSNQNLAPVCSGYCKLTDLGSVVPGGLGKLGWVVCATKLHGEDIRRSQNMNLFSLPLFEAVATGVAYGIFRNDRKIRDLHPTLGTMAPAAIGSAMSDSMHGVGAERWMRIDAADSNPLVGASTSFKPVINDGFAPGKVLEVKALADDDHVGAIYPLKKNNNAFKDGTVVDRLMVGELPVSYAKYPEATGICRYIVSAFNNNYEGGAKPFAQLDIHPLAYADSNDRLTLRDHMAKPKVGTKWITPGVGEVMVTEAEVALATSEISPWDQRLTASVEKAVYKIRTGQVNEMAAL